MKNLNKHIKILNIKFTAFTLAEILITLGIIGIIAAITIPTIIGNSDKQATVSKVKEAYSILAQATTQINNDCGGNIMGCITSTTSNNPNDNTARMELANLYKQKLSLGKDCTDGITTGCFADQMYLHFNNTNCTNFESSNVFDRSRFILTNGISIDFDWRGPTSAPNYSNIYIDVNGVKPPNQMGKDTFAFYYDMNQRLILPYANNDCLTGGGGYGCAKKILQESAINYY